MRVCLVVPPALSNSYEGSLVCLPHGLAILAAQLRAADHEVDFYDLNAHLRSNHSKAYSMRTIFRLSSLEKELHKEKRYQGITDVRVREIISKWFHGDNLLEYECIGISICSHVQAYTAFLIAEYIKEHFAIPVVIGGPYVTAYADKFFEKYSFLEYAIVGFGEEPLLLLLSALDGKKSLNAIPSLWYRTPSGDVHFTGRKNYSIKNQPCPDYAGCDLALYRIDTTTGKNVVPIPYSLSRGCPHACAFCLYGVIDGKWQKKDVDTIIRDLNELVKKCKSNVFRFEDPSFNVAEDFTHALSEALIKSKLNIKWSVRSRAENYSKELLQKMKQAGCAMLQFGIESASDNLLQRMGKRVTVAEQRQVLHDAKSVGISTMIYLMLRYPYETRQDLFKTALFLRENKKVIDKAFVYNYIVQIGSHMSMHEDTYGIVLRSLPHTHYSYQFAFVEKNEATEKERCELIKKRKQVRDIWCRHILCKSARFPYKLFLYWFKTRFLYYALKRNDFNEIVIR